MSPSAAVRPAPASDHVCVHCGDLSSVVRRVRTSLSLLGDLSLCRLLCRRCRRRSLLVQPCAPPRSKAVSIRLSAASHADLDRIIVKSRGCVVRLPQFRLQIPSGESRAGVFSVAQLLSRIASEIHNVIGQRDEHEVFTTVQFDEGVHLGQVLKQLRSVDTWSDELVVELDDVAGNSDILNRGQQRGSDSACHRSYPEVLREQGDVVDAMFADLRRVDSCALAVAPVAVDAFAAEAFDCGMDVDTDDVAVLPRPCSACEAVGACIAAVQLIPRFQPVLLLQQECDACGHVDTLVKPSGPLPPQGRRLVFTVTSSHQFDVVLLKTESASVELPELGLECGRGTLGSIYTTVYGLLFAMHRQLDSSSVVVGDAQSETLHSWLQRFSSILSGDGFPFTLVVDDPLGSCFIGSADKFPSEAAVAIEDYERTAQQNLELLGVEMPQSSDASA